MFLRDLIMIHATRVCLPCMNFTQLLPGFSICDENSEVS